MKIYCLDFLRTNGSIRKDSNRFDYHRKVDTTTIDGPSLTSVRFNDFEFLETNRSVRKDSNRFDYHREVDRTLIDGLSLTSVQFIDLNILNQDYDLSYQYKNRNVSFVNKMVAVSRTCRTKDRGVTAFKYNSRKNKFLIYFMDILLYNIWNFIDILTKNSIHS